MEPDRDFLEDNNYGKFKKTTKKCLATCQQNYQTFEEKESWIGAIGKAMVKTGNNIIIGNI